MKGNTPHEETNSELEFQTVETENLHENKMEEANKSKSGHVMNNIFKVLRILTIVLYIILNIGLIYSVFAQIKYPAIPDKDVTQGIFIISAITVLFPAILIAILFIKKDHIVLKVFKCIIQILLLAALPYVFILGALLTFGIPSHTTNPANYEIRDDYVNNMLEKLNFSILPKTLPDDVTDVVYLYDYLATFDKELTLEVTFMYNDIADYQKAKSEMQAYEPVNHQASEDGFQMIYASGDSSIDDKYVCFGYNDEINRVTYRIHYLIK